MDTSTHPRFSQPAETQCWEINPGGTVPWKHLQPGELDPIRTHLVGLSSPVLGLSLSGRKREKSTKKLSRIKTSSEKRNSWSLRVAHRGRGDVSPLRIRRGSNFKSNILISSHISGPCCGTVLFLLPEPSWVRSVTCVVQRSREVTVPTPWAASPRHTINSS